MVNISSFPKDVPVGIFSEMETLYCVVPHKREKLESVRVLQRNNLKNPDSLGY